jgi:hypothetical protein
MDQRIHVPRVDAGMSDVDHILYTLSIHGYVGNALLAEWLWQLYSRTQGVTWAKVPTHSIDVFNAISPFIAP